MEIYRSKSDQPLVAWQWHEPSLRNITHYILKFASRSSGRALDVGCGTARVSFGLAEQGYKVYGIDIEKRVIDIARDIAKEIGSLAQFDVADFSNGNLVQADFYDLIVCSEVLEHVQEYRPLVDNMYRALKPGGLLIVTVPFDPRKWSVLDEYGGHVRRFTIEQIQNDLAKFINLNIIVTGFPFYRLLVRIYLVKNRLLGKEHSNEILWTSFRMRLIATLLYPLIRFDNLFAFSRLGDALIATCVKPSSD